MNNDNKNGSIQKRFILAALVIGLFLTLCTIAAQYYVSVLTRERTENIRYRQSLLINTTMIRNAIWASGNILTEHLLRPFPTAEKIWVEQFSVASKHAELLLDTDWVKKHNEEKTVRQLISNLKKYNKESISLMKLRLDAARQHPALFYARETMLPVNRAYVTAASLALQEFQEDRNFIHNINYKDFIEARHLWTQLISNFRMYVINRLGSFDVSTLPVQENDIETLYKQLVAILERLQRKAQKDELGIQASASIETMLEAVKKWDHDFKIVKKIHASPNWRTDIVIVKDIIQPLDQSILANIQELEKQVENSAQNDISALATMTDSIAYAMWILLFAGLLTIFLGINYFRKFILKPIETIATALKAEATGELDIALPEINTIEIMNLTDAFSIMRKQVHTRQAALEYQAMHDALTGLPNRTLLLDRAQQAITNLHRDKGLLALIMMDLDRFKEINDTLGHQIGDMILEQVGSRLIKTLRESDTVARLGGDEFAILLPIKSEKHATDVALKIIDALEDEFRVNSHQLFVGASIGIAIYPNHGSTTEILIQHADVAMYEAKRKNTGFAIYDPAQDQGNMGRLALANDLKHAIEAKSLMLYYQPKQKLANGRIIGCEALLRWNHPDRGFVSPEEIIFIAEHTGLIKPLTNWVLQHAISQCAEWNASGSDISISVNLSVYNLQDQFLVSQIEQYLNQYHLNPQRLVVEVTESAMMVEPERASDTLRKLDRMGVWISIDDYGTGFSSLAYLRQLPVDELKIDKSFTLNMTTNDNDGVIVRSTIDLAKNLGLKVVGEGVEDQKTYASLKNLGCDYVQGYHISRPLPEQEFKKWLDDRNTPN